MAVLLLALAGGHGDWLALGLNWLCGAAVPVAFSAGLLQLARRKLPAQLFVYVFINAFIAGGLSLFCSALAGMLALGMPCCLWLGLPAGRGLAVLPVVVVGGVYQRPDHCRTGGVPAAMGQYV
jgi:hypothetical protein